MKLDELIAQNRVVVCLGSGGVGKTTTSAALALAAARAGRRTLCLTIDPARRLANSLGLDALSHEPQRIEPSVLAAAGSPVSGELWAMMLDMKHTFDALVIEHARSAAQRERIFANPLYRYVSTSLAGTQEYMAMEKLHAVRADPRFDFIVLDTPPTTNALDFLDAPQKLVGAIDSPVMRWFVEQLEARRGLSLLGRGAAFVLRGLSRFTGAAFLEQVGEFITGINELFGGFRDRAKAVYDGLRQADVAFVIVTSPSPVTVAEAMFFHDKLGAYGIEPSGVIVNRVHVADRRFEQVSSEALARVAPAGVDVADLHRRMQRAASDLAQLAERDAEGIRRMRQHLGERLPHVIVPALERDVHDLAALAQVGEHLRRAA